MDTTIAHAPGDRREAGGTEAASFELHDLLSPVAPIDFLEQYWQRNPLFIRGSPGKFTGLFDRARFDQAVARKRELEHVPSFQVNAIRPKVSDEPLTLATLERVDPDGIDRLLEEGVTICVNDISAADPDLAASASKIKSQMRYTGQAKFNCYLSPDGSGADTHFDARVSTTLQIEGSKRWRFSSRPVVDWPLSNAQLDHDETPVWMGASVMVDECDRLPVVDESSFAEVVLSPGDVLCLPAGTWHNAKAIGHSLALNLAFSPRGFPTLLMRLLEQLTWQRPEWRAGPPPVHVTGADGVALPPQVEDYLADRLQELREFIDSIDLRSAAVRDLWQDLSHR